MSHIHWERFEFAWWVHLLPVVIFAGAVMCLFAWMCGMISTGN